MSVAKTIEIHAEGDTIEAATEAAVQQASKTVENVKSVYVEDFQALVEDGEVHAYRVHTKITFVLRS